MYTIGTILKHSELDLYAEGCQPETSQSTSFELNIKKLTLEGVLKELQSYLGESYQINPIGDELNRIDFQRMEDEEGLEATKGEIELWEEGKIKLWLVDYTVYIYKLEDADLSELKQEQHA